MKKIRLKKSDAILFYRLNLISEIQSLKKALESYELKYGMDFKSFEQQIQHKQSENFQEWDDYLEWKSFWQSYQEKINELKELESETDFEIITEE